VQDKNQTPKTQKQTKPTKTQKANNPNRTKTKTSTAGGQLISS